MFASLTKCKPKLFLFTDYPNPSEITRERLTITLNLLTCGSGQQLRSKSRICYVKQHANTEYKAGPVCRICSLQNFSSLPQMTVNFLCHSSKDPTPTPSRQFCQNHSIRKLSKKKSLPWQLRDHSAAEQILH